MNCDFRFLVFVYLVLVSAFNAHRAEAGVVLQGGGATFPIRSMPNGSPPLAKLIKA